MVGSSIVVVIILPEVRPALGDGCLAASFAGQPAPVFLCPGPDVGRITCAHGDVRLPFFAAEGRGLQPRRMVNRYRKELSIHSQHIGEHARLHQKASVWAQVETDRSADLSALGAAQRVTLPTLGDPAPRQSRGLIACGDDIYARGDYEG